MAEIINQEIRTTLSADDQMTNVIKRAANELDDFSDVALKGAQYLSRVFNKDQIKQAENFAKVFRNFNDSLERDTESGLASIFSAETAKSLGDAFAMLTPAQSSAIVNFFKEPEIEAENFAETAQVLSGYLSNMFSKEDIKKAQEMANAMRVFNEGWQADSKAGLEQMKGVQTVEKLAEAFSKLTSTQASAISRLYTETEVESSPIREKLKAFSDNAHKSLSRFRHGVDRIANIVRYRLIRQGLSLIVSQIREGTRSVYLFSRSFSELDKNGIAEKLDKYATAFDNIRGNLGAAWATTLAELSNVFSPLLDKINEAIEKVTAFSSAMNGNATYLGVAADNAKRYYSTVANGLQDIKVINSSTRFEEKDVPLEVSNFADKIRSNLAGIGDLTGGVGAGLAVLLIGTGHVVAGLEVGAAALGITNLSNQVNDNDTKGKIEKVFKNIGSILPGIELGLGLMLAANGHFEFGVPLIVKAASDELDKIADFDLEADLKKKFKIADAVLDAMSLGLGAILCYFGQYQYGVPLLITGLVSTGKDISHNWDGIMAAFEDLGTKIEIWWWSLWNGLTGASWTEKVNAFYEAFPERNPQKATATPYNLSGLTDEGQKILDAINNSTRLELSIQTSKETNQFAEWWTERTEALADAVEGLVSGISGAAAKVTKYPLHALREKLGYADGGFPDAGSLFIAGEIPGQTELLGTINGRTGVAGGEEITGIRQAIYEVGAELLSGMAANRTVVSIEGDSDKIFNVVRDKSREYTRRTGEFAF